MKFLKNTFNFAKEYKFIGIILLVGLLIRLPYLKTNVFKVDLIIYQFWSLDLVQHGLKQFFEVSNSDYTPGYLYILLIVGKFFYYFLNHGINFNIDSFYKIVPVFFDLCNIALVYLLAKKIVSENKSLMIALIFAVLPPVIIISTLWGQTDGIMVFFILSGLYLLLNNKLFISALLFGYGLSFKPVILICLPFVGIYTYKKLGLKKMAKFSAVFLIFFILLFLPFNNSNNLFGFIAKRFFETTTRYSFVTVNAFNMWALISTTTTGLMNRINNNIVCLLSYKNWGYLLFVTFYCGLIFRAIKKSKIEMISMLRYFALSLWGMFIFFTGMHERHLYYGFFTTVFLLLLIKNKKRINYLIALIVTLVYCINLVYAYKIQSAVNDIILNGWQIKLISTINIISFLYIYYSQIISNHNQTNNEV